MSYAYTPIGQLSAMTDAAGNQWSYAYDLAGNRIRSDDPDKGVTTSVFDLAGKVVSTTDARGQGAKTVYDQVGRVVMTTDLAGGTLTTSVWDTVMKGLLSSSSRHVDGAQVTSRIDSYDAAGRVTGSAMVVPQIAGLVPAQVAGTYSTT